MDLPTKLSFHVLPASCVLCGSRGGTRRDLCSACERDLPRLNHACLLCAIPLAPNATVCGRCQQRHPPQQDTRAVFLYAWPVDRLIQRFKFHADQAAGRVLAELFADALAGYGNERPQLLLPVPLHDTRLRERGFNQSELLAQALARRWRVPLAIHAVKRQRMTAVQSGMNAAARRRNVRQAFSLHARKLPAHVAIVDDVVTTGSTVMEIADLLLQNGVARITVLALARTA